MGAIECAFTTTTTATTSQTVIKGNILAAIAAAICWTDLDKKSQLVFTKHRCINQTGPCYKNLFFPHSLKKDTFPLTVSHSELQFYLN